MPTRRTQAERSRTTRAALLAAGRALFAEHGFARTGREQIVEQAGVTRGALYHHFTGKEDLFRAVVEELEQEVMTKVAVAAMKGGDAGERLRLGSMAFLDACLDPAVQRIVVLDAPSVLGWEQWREIEQRYGLALLEEGLQHAVDEGLLPAQPVTPLAHLLLAALQEAAMLVATAPRPRVARREVGATLEALLAQLVGSSR
jgi:AcrR family transcriptional regulator